MKTVKDLRLLYKQETGQYPKTYLNGDIADDEAYVKWLEQYVLSHESIQQVTSEPAG
jgi:hypothetical protein